MYFKIQNKLIYEPNFTSNNAHPHWKLFKFFQKFLWSETQSSDHSKVNEKTGKYWHYENLNFCRTKTVQQRPLTLNSHLQKSERKYSQYIISCDRIPWKKRFNKFFGQKLPVFLSGILRSSIPICNFGLLCYVYCQQ